MIAATETLWLRAVNAVGQRGLLPDKAFSLTPEELGNEVARRGDERLLQLALGWYYPASYGRIRGVLSDEDAMRLVAALEAAVAFAEADASPEQSARLPEIPRSRKKTRNCELCGLQITGS
ncbi:MAG TPA: hypothetical protein VKT72_08445 [Candidatus Baltobacteraceae bacterium]|nr:hypothetical protein [Candidatus Baltobacteraceae bacterium]